MKATLFAMVVSFSVVSFSTPIFANDAQVKSPVLSSPPASQKINLNTADIKTLTQSFKGIGQKRAQAIIDYRQKHGNFKSIAELAEVRGLGKTFVNAHLSQLQAVFVIG